MQYSRGIRTLLLHMSCQRILFTGKLSMEPLFTPGGQYHYVKTMNFELKFWIFVSLFNSRFLTKTNKIPKWGERWLSGFRRSVPLLEESFVNTRERTITTYTRNVGMANFMTAIEKVIFLLGDKGKSI